MDYEVQRSARQCAATGHEFAPGEEYYSVLVVQGAETQRLDYTVDAWQGPPPGAVGWWKSRRPDESARSPYWAPNDVLLDYFDRLESQPDSDDIRYVLTLLLVRRRVMRLEDNETDEQGRESLVAYCPRRETTYRVAPVTPNASRTAQIQEQLARLLQ